MARKPNKLPINRASFALNLIKTRDLIDLLGWQENPTSADVAAALLSALHRIACLEDDAADRPGDGQADAGQAVTDPRD